MSHVIECPVCHFPMKASGINSDMYFCARRKIYSTYLSIWLDIVDATICVAPNGQRTLSIIEVPPYTFTIRDDEIGQKTEVRKIIPVDVVMGKAQSLDRVKVFEVDSIMNLPWDNAKRVIERVGVYLLFS